MERTQELINRKSEEKRLRETVLPDECFIVSLDKKFASPPLIGGRVMAADKATAAYCIAFETHELASKEQTDTFRADQLARKAAIEAEFVESQKKFHTTTVINNVLPDSLVAQIQATESAPVIKPKK